MADAHSVALVMCPSERDFSEYVREAWFIVAFRLLEIFLTCLDDLMVSPHSALVYRSVHTRKAV